MSYELPVLSYNAELLTPFYFTCPIAGKNDIRISHVYRVEPPADNMPLFTNNYLDCLPDDITKMIMDKVNTPSIEELTSNVYDCVRERYRPVSFALEEDQLYDELEIDSGDAKLYYIDVIDSVNETLCKLELNQIHNIYNDMFYHKKNAIDFLNNDNSGYGNSDDTLYDDSVPDDYVKGQSVIVKLFQSYVENYKLVFDEDSFVPDEDDEGWWGAKTIIKHRMTNSSNFLM